MTRRFLIGALALGLLAAPALADTVPELDVETTCKSANRGNVGLGDTASEAGCLRSERGARAEAERNWDTYKPAAKAQCQSQFKTGGFPSYVELVTCLELASGSAPAQTGGRPGSPGGRAAPKESSGNLTREPAPSQRTNPIDVLDKK